MPNKAYILHQSTLVIGLIEWRLEVIFTWSISADIDIRLKIGDFIFFSGFSLRVNWFEKQFQSFFKSCIWTRFAVWEATSPEAKKKNNASVSKYANKAGEINEMAYSRASFPGLSSTSGWTFPGLLVGIYLSVNQSAFMTTSASTAVSRVIMPSLILSLR